MPDDHLPDLLRQVGTEDATTVGAYAAVVETLAEGASADQAARLVQIAHARGVERERDEWFWRPFRDVDQAFPATDAPPLHARLADSCLRQRIADGSQLDALAVRLAALAGWEPATPLLHAAAAALIAALHEPPAAPATERAKRSSTWTDADATKLAEKFPDALDFDALTTLAKTLGGNVDQMLTPLRTQLSSLRSWADRAVSRLQREQAVTQWVVGGMRDDGAEWDSLDAATTCVDAAAELARVLDGSAPERRHEHLLLLVLRAAGVDLDTTPPPAASRHLDGDVPAALRPLVIVRTAAAAGDTLGLSARDLAVRVLWESVALDAWDSA